MAVKMSKKFPTFVIYSYLKTVHLQQLKGIPFVPVEGIQKRYLLCHKWYIKGKGVLPQGGASEYNPLFYPLRTSISNFTI